MPNITKDEMRFIACFIQHAKYDATNLANGEFALLDKIATKFHEISKDQRRVGRTSMNDYSDLLKRLK